MNTQIFKIQFVELDFENEKKNIPRNEHHDFTSDCFRIKTLQFYFYIIDLFTHYGQKYSCTTS